MEWIKGKFKLKIHSKKRRILNIHTYTHTQTNSLGTLKQQHNPNSLSYTSQSHKVNKHYHRYSRWTSIFEKKPFLVLNFYIYVFFSLWIFFRSIVFFASDTNIWNNNKPKKAMEKLFLCPHINVFLSTLLKVLFIYIYLINSVSSGQTLSVKNKIMSIKRKKKSYWQKAILMLIHINTTSSCSIEALQCQKLSCHHYTYNMANILLFNLHFLIYYSELCEFFSFILIASLLSSSVRILNYLLVSIFIVSHNVRYVLIGTF